MMEDFEETLDNYSGYDYIEGACLALDNGKRHFQVSELVEKSHVGIALSHLVLGAEEYIKAMLLLNLSGVNDFLTKKEKIKLFRDHTFKHKNIAEFFNSLTDKSSKEFEDNLFGYATSRYSLKSKFTLDGFYINKVWSFSKLEEGDVEQVMNWLAKANKLKNAGFYLDLKTDWESPDKFTDKDLFESKRIVQILKDAIEPLFEMPLTDDDFLRFLNSE